MAEQLNFFDMMGEQDEEYSKGLHVVHAEFVNVERENWKELFDGYDEIYGITYSSGLGFMEQVLELFAHAEFIFGCEGVMDSDVAALMSMQTKSVELIAKRKSIAYMTKRLDDGSLTLHVSRDTKSHEKIFILKANDGRTRVITGSANMSASAFCGLQREDIVCFDNEAAFQHYKEYFEEYQERCADNVTEQVLIRLQKDSDYLRDHVEEVPIVKTIENKKIVILESDEQSDHEVEVIADIKGLEKEMKPMLPKKREKQGKIVLEGDYFKAFKRKHKEFVSVKKVKEKKAPKLHIDYDTGILTFNNKELGKQSSEEKIESDIQCIKSFMSSLSGFYGDWQQSQKEYFKFMSWYFASIFMPYLRYIGEKNNYEMTPFPVFGIIYGDSNGGKSTFVKLMSKLMCGVKVPFNKSADFTYVNIENLKRLCEGLPINIDDLAKVQYDGHYEKVIKDDGWGIQEGFIHYPAVTITTNKIASIKEDISKRVVTCHIGIKLDKETGAKNSKRINESMRHATTAFYCEYVSRMYKKVMKMAEEMKKGNDDYFPDVFEASSATLVEMFSEYSQSIPEYARVLTYSDYFGDKAVGRNAMRKVMRAWENDKKMFEVNRRKNTLTYRYADNSRTYELRYIQQELPPVLEAKVVGSSIVMELDKAKEVFGVEFRKLF
ncbi:MAG: phospholipase D family protein [Eubacterium sp.]|nr:phospholipase D family protein [Eubacterium sp.]